MIDDGQPYKIAGKERDLIPDQRAEVISRNADGKSEYDAETKAKEDFRVLDNT